MDAGLLLVGSRPGSTEPPQHFGRTFQVETPKTPKSKPYVSKYQERLFTGPGTQTYSTSPQRQTNGTVARPARSQSQSPIPQCKENSPRPSTPKKRGAQRVNPSYVDETLFGDRPIEPDFPAPWDDGKKQVFVKDATDYKLQQKLREQRERSVKDSPAKRSSPMVASHTVLKSKSKGKSGQGKPNFKPSHVDELLFGSNNSLTHAGPSWEAAAGPAHDPLNTGRISLSGTRAPSRQGRPPSPGRPHSGRSPSPGARSRPGSANRQQSPGGRHTPSYVDESLFGPKPTEADWPAPWEDLEAERKRGRPLLFDATDHRVTIYHDNNNQRPSSTRSNSQPRPGSASKKPAWR